MLPRKIKKGKISIYENADQLKLTKNILSCNGIRLTRKTTKVIIVLMGSFWVPGKKWGF